MKTAMKLCLVILASILFGACSSPQNKISKTIHLTDDWKIQQADSVALGGETVSSSGINTSKWYKATVPSTLMGVLTQNGLCADALTSKNMKTIDKKVFNSPWWYRTEFDLPKKGNNQHIFLNFDGLIYSADIWLNGQLIASRDSVYGTFRQFEFDVTKHIKEKNILAVQLFRPLPGDPNIGFADWNPRPSDENMGIFREVRVRTTGDVKLENTYIQSKVNTETLDEAWLTFETNLTNYSESSVSGKLIGEIEGKTFSRTIALAPGESKKVRLTADDIAMFHVKKPRLWWCNNMGKAELYDLNLRFVVNNEISSTDKITFGIREVESYLTDAGHRAFKLNGKKILLKGAGWTDDIFLRDTPERNEIQVKYVKDMNLNLIRFENFWGNTQSIYELCDKYGILALVGWSCHWEWDAYYGKPCDLEHGCIQTEEEIALIAASFRDQVLWLRNHPSIVAWVPGSDMLPKPELEVEYMRILNEVDNNRPYVGAAKERTSPITGVTGTKMAGPYEYVGPNYWYTDTLYGGAFGFNTETGIGAQLPVLESIKRFIPSNRLWPINDEWSYHCTASGTAMNSLLTMTKVIDQKYGRAKNLDDYLKKANLVNYDGTRAMFEAFRVNIDNTTGIVQWMLNSAWPSFYWQLYDYYMVPTAGYYSTKKANQLQQLIYNYGNNAIYVVNEKTDSLIDSKAIVKVYSMDSKLLSENELSIGSISYNTSKKIFELPIVEENTIVFLSLIDKNGLPIADNSYALSVKHDEYLWDKTTWVSTPMKAYNDYRSLSAFPQVQLRHDLSMTETDEDASIKLILENTSSTIAFFTELKLVDADGQMITPVFWSDNYVSLQPNSKIELHCTISKRTPNNSPRHIIVSGWNVEQKMIDVK